MKPVLSVIITTYNRPDLLVKAIQSVLLQDFTELEIIVIDDASKEDVLFVLRNKFPQEIAAGKLRCYRNETNSERSFSRNRGMENARGYFFAFLDDDDVWLPSHAREMLDFSRNNPDVGMVITNYFNETEDGKKSVVYRGIKTGKGPAYRDRCISRMLVSGSIYCIKKEVFEKLGGFIRDLEPAEDREYLSRIAMNYNVGYIAEPSVAKFTHRGSFAYKTSLSRHALLKEKVWLAVEENSRKFGYPLKQSICADWYLHLAVNFLPDLDKAKVYLDKAVIASPRCLFSPASLGLLLKVVMGARLYGVLRKVKGLLYKG